MASPYLLHGLGRGRYAAVSVGFKKLFDSECFAGFVVGSMDLVVGVSMAALVGG